MLYIFFTFFLKFLRGQNIELIHLTTRYRHKPQATSTTKTTSVKVKHVAEEEVSITINSNSKPVQAVREFGITDFDNFRSIDYDHKWEFEENNAKVIVMGNYGVILSTIIAYARDLETKADADKNSPQNWTSEKLVWRRRTEYSAWWRKSGAAEAASSTPTVSTTNADARSTLAAGDDCTKLNDFSKTPKS